MFFFLIVRFKSFSAYGTIDSVHLYRAAAVFAEPAHVFRNLLFFVISRQYYIFYIIIFLSVSQVYLYIIYNILKNL